MEMIDCYVNNGKAKYDPKLQIRILNPKQALFYCSKSVPLTDVYPSYDMKNKRPVFVYLFPREATKESYTEWCKMGEELRNQAKAEEPSES